MCPPCPDGEGRGVYTRPASLATGGIWFAPLLALSGTAFPLNSSALYATLELTLLGLLSWVVASAASLLAAARAPSSSSRATSAVTPSLQRESAQRRRG